MEKHKIEALIFLSVNKNELININEQVSAIREVKRAYEVLGNYDLVLFVNVPTRADLGRIIDKISTLKGVRAISTFILTERIK
ncbi:Lrp/AsnC ligand binding domain-containing protein [Thermococcus bergensis]|uniref:Lrp/AsnC ligand binding domain-containing protein n=1 Tax=Thermococcus bergensis TaxID=2689387 RepID=UPI001CEDCB85|nr:Lrp/AsnC ligand binding domain-containing protein [Thermococcus bergensis]MCA6214124.1 Lrp/AsnC ligand binding domain-containing protein [Thermococcus bergensis]